MSWCTLCEKDAGGKFCGTCGTLLTEKPSKCRCGALQDVEEDRFCYMCGRDKEVPDVVSVHATNESLLQRFLSWWAK